jgi:hypothetical protein
MSERKFQPWMRREQALILSAVAAVSLMAVDGVSPAWPTSIALAAGITFGRAARGSVAPRKMACRPAAGSVRMHCGSRPSTRAEGAAWSLPLCNREWTPTEPATLSSSPPCRSFAHSSRGLVATLFWGAVFFALGVGAVLGAALMHWL